MLICKNCNRCNIDTFGNVLPNIDIMQRATIGMHFGKKLSSFPKNCTAPEVLICLECYKTLMAQSIEELSNDWEYCWAAFLWKFFQTLDTVDDFCQMWKLLPLTLRNYWFASYERLCEKCNIVIDLHNIPSDIEDVTKKADQIDNLNTSGKLRDLMDSCNMNCCCSVMCPWGCTEFVDECGYIPFFRLLKLKFPEKKLPLSYKVIGIKNYTKHHRNTSDVFVGMRSDYFDSAYDFMENNNWRVQPCIRFLKGQGLFLCTCKEHDGGSVVNYIHPPRNPVSSIYPSTNGDQLAHAVLKPRVVKTIKCNNYSDTYQMQNCYGGYRGVDSCDITDIGNYSDSNILCNKNISLTLHERPDIRHKLSQLVQEKIVPNTYEEDKLMMVQEDITESVMEQIENTLRGSSHISLKDAINMHCSEEYSTKFKYNASWPMFLIQCSRKDKIGFKPYHLPLFQSTKDLRYPWITLSLITSIPSLWEAMNETVYSNVNVVSWHGFIMNFAAKNVLPTYKGNFGKGIKQSTKNPYHNNSINAIKLSWMMENGCEDLSGIAHYNPSFQAVKFRQMLSSIKGVITFSSWNDIVEIMNNSNHGMLTPETRFFIIVQEDDVISEHYEDTFTIQGPNTQKYTGNICYVGEITGKTGTGKFNNWDFKAFSNCATSSTQNYGWKIGRLKEPAYTSRENVIPQIIIYEISSYESVKRDEKLYKNRYMNFMGYNCNSTCMLHHLPMTTMISGSGYVCCNVHSNGSSCKKAAFLECPSSSCYYKLCKQCSIELQPSQKLTEKNNIGEANARAKSVDGEQVILGEFNCDNDTSSSSTSVNDEGEKRKSTKHYLNNDYIIPTTNTEGKMIRVKLKEKIKLKERIRKFGLHVLLNEHCSLLVRRGSQLKPTRAAKGFFERIIATSDGKSIPLLYPEAMIFPSIFWKQNIDGSYPGALPIGLYSTTSEAHQLGFAGLAEHMRCRLKNSSLLCSTDPRYIYFAFDAVYNVMSRGVDNRIVFKRGFEHMLGPCTMSGQNNDSLLSSDMIDSRRNVQKLAALVRDKEPSYFYTHTCNQKEHFGIAPLRKWLAYKLDELLKDSTLSKSEFDELVRAYHIAISTQIIRTWFKVGRMYMNYIISSSEHPLGKIERHWWRWEYQDAMGNLPHIHCLLWTTENKHNADDLIRLQSRIKCSQETFLNQSEVQELFQEGLLPDTSTDTVMDVLDSAACILSHNCEQAKYRCMKRIGLGVRDLKCRYVDYFKENPNPAVYGYKRINPKHREESLEVLQKLGLFNEEGVEQDYRFRAGRYVYPAEQGQFLSPCNPRLFISHKSSDNLVITDTYFSCRYLAKYVQGLDENCKVQLKAGKQKDEILLQEQQITNTKITSGKLYEEKRQKKMKMNPAYLGRAIGLPEVIGLLLQEQQVFTEASFISIPTVPLEQRPAHEKVKKYNWCTDVEKEHSRAAVAIGEGTRNFVAQRFREEIQLPLNRQFDMIQQVVIQDALSSPLSLDAITLYSCRPPELLFINSPVLYFKYFTRLPHRPRNPNTGKTTTETLLTNNILRSGWVDGLDCQVVVKPIAIEYILKMEECVGEIRRLFQILSYVCFGNYAETMLLDGIFPTLDSYKKIYIDSKYSDGKELPFPLFNVVRPTQANRFLIHILLSMGKFTSEAHLFQGQNMIDFFRNASLISLVDSPTESDVNKIVKHFILHQLLYVPGGTLKFDRYCVAAYDTVKNALLVDSLVSTDAPSYLYTTLVEEANKSAFTMKMEMKSCLVKSLSSLPNTPTESDLMQCAKNNTLTWKPTILKMEDQSELSYNEAISVCNLTTKAIDMYETACPYTVKSILICGGPGTGKTYQLRLASTYALSKGLNTTITAIMAERALFLGGRHLHYLFCIPGDNTTNIHKVIDQSIRGLNQNPERLQFLRTLDVMLLDEAGYMSANMLNITDTVLRKIRGKSSFMGGVLLIATIDDQQLPPIKAKPLLISSLIPVSFQMIALEHSVRARTDCYLQRLISISRELNPSDDEAAEFVKIIIHHCVHVKSWNDDKIVQGTVRILGTKKALLKVEKEYYKKISDEGHTILIREAETTQSSIGSHGNWKVAEKNIAESLDRFVNEVQTLKLHEKMMVEMTYNKANAWSHSQVGLLLELPDVNHLQNWKPIPIMLAPAGINKLPDGEISKQRLINNGWKEVKVGVAPEKEVRLYGRISAKRKQYAFKPRIAMTVHKALGQDLGSIATSVVSSDDGDNYLLWQREQVEVLISRTHTTKDIIFVGDPQETALNLVQLLFKTSPFSSYMRHIVKQMTTSDPSNFLLQPLKYLPYTVRECLLPPKSCGVVYLLLSLSDHNTTYIGETNNMKKRLEQHNAGIGSIITTPISLRPWHPIAFIIGFDISEERERKDIEKLWHQRKNYGGRSSRNIIDVLELGKGIVGEKNETYYESPKLKFVQCIQFTNVK